MDQRSFDRIARLFGGAASRRAGLKALVGAFAGVAVSRADADADADANGRPRRGHAPGTEGPCGDGSRKDNVCTRNRQCCTGYCEKDLKNRDRKGRCRCIRKGQPCKPSQTCCGERTCTNGKCAPGKGPIPTGEACAAGDVCADADAECTVYAGGTPAGTWCLLPGGKPCSSASWCESSVCTSGICAAANGDSCDGGIVCADAAASCRGYDIGPGAPAGNFCVLPLANACNADDECVSAWCLNGTCQKCTVCPGGACDYTTLYDAVDAATSGAVIGIAPGAYDDTAQFKVSATVRRCGSRGTVAVTGDQNTPNFNGQCAICVDGVGIEVGISDVAITGADGDQVVRIDNGSLTLTRCSVTMVTGGQVFTAPVSVYKDTSLTLVDCLIDGNVSPGDGTIAVDDATLTATNTVFSNNTADGDGGALLVNGGIVTLTGCTLTGNTASGTDGGGGAIAIFNAATPVTLTDCLISGNTASYYGGGIFLEVGVKTALLTLDGTTSVTGNTASVDGGGIATSRNTGSITITGASTRVSGNTGGDQCIQSTDSGTTYTAVSGCAY